ncbi:hypothetical protein [Brevundimonas sp.]|uniref:hypothetical protein n=1 Tax=Brevundimonas sp. TaxID=1871086 RepID=UPI002ED94D04
MSLLLATLAAVALTMQQGREAVQVPWTLDLPTFEGATIDATCDAPPARYPHCVYLPLARVSAYYETLLTANWRLVADSGEMRLYQRAREDGQCDTFSVWIAGRGEDGLLVLRQFEPVACAFRT